MSGSSPAPGVPMARVNAAGQGHGVPFGGQPEVGQGLGQGVVAGQLVEPPARDR